MRFKGSSLFFAAVLIFCPFAYGEPLSRDVLLNGIDILIAKAEPIDEGDLGPALGVNLKNYEPPPTGFHNKIWVAKTPSTIERIELTSPLPAQYQTQTIRFTLSASDCVPLVKIRDRLRVNYSDNILPASPHSIGGQAYKDGYLFRIAKGGSGYTTLEANALCATVFRITKSF
jgi:hypothetical protein